MKRWQAGVADEAWKVMVCANDAATASRTLSALGYILTNAGDDIEAVKRALAAMSGAQIVAQLVAYQASAEQSVRTALQTSRAPIVSEESAP